MKQSDLEVLHPDYTANYKVWSTLRDAYSGPEAIQAGGEKYVPRLDGQDPTTYRKYITYYGKYFPALERTIEVFLGLIHRKQYTLKEADSVPEDILTHLFAKFTDDGRTFKQFLREGTLETLIINRFIVVLDLPNIEEGLTKKDYEELRPYPFVRTFQAESLLNWFTGVGPDGRTITTYVCLHTKELEQDGYEHVTVDKYLVYDLVKVKDLDEDKTIVRKQLFTVYETANNQMKVVTDYPQVNDEHLTEIPVYNLGGDNTLKVTQPFFTNLSHLVLYHYRLSIKLGYALHYVGSPTPYAAGVKRNELTVTDVVTNETVIPFGPSVMWVTPRSAQDVTFGMLSYSGDGLELIDKQMLDTKDEISLIGARALSTQRKQVETAETATINRSGENANLTTMSSTISDQVTVIVNKMLTWITGEVYKDFRVDLNTDFISQEISPQKFTALYKSYLEGALPLEDYLLALQKGEIVDHERKLDDFKKDLKSSDKVDLGQQQNVPLTEAPLQDEAPTEMNSQDNEVDTNGTE